MASDGGKPGKVDAGPVVRAFSTSVHGNSQAFGFSIAITATFGMISNQEGAPTIPELIYFGVAAATGIAALEALVTRLFTARAVESPSEVQMLGTAMNMLSVAGAVAVGLLAATIVDGTPAWPVAAFFAAVAYVTLEALEVLVAEAIQSARGDPEAHEEQAE